MDKNLKNNFRAKLLTIQKELTDKLNKERLFFQNHNPFQESKDEGDMGEATLESELERTSQKRIYQLLELINQSLKKIEIGTYGKCELCQREISLERLEAVPYTPFCSECQKRTEKPSQ